MQIKINGETETFEEALSITRLLELREVESPDMVSVQLNGNIIERPAYTSTLLNDGDELEFLYFMGGGADQ